MAALPVHSLCILQTLQAGFSKIKPANVMSQPNVSLNIKNEKQNERFMCVFSLDLGVKVCCRELYSPKNGRVPLSSCRGSD